MFVGMRRRDVIAGFGASAIWPLGAPAQQSQPVIGLLSSLSMKPVAKFVAAIHRGLKDRGFVEGQNLKIEQRWADGKYDRLPALAKELADLRVAAIATIGGNVAVLAARTATTTIPIIFATADDPVASGLVTNFTRPSANLTGVTWMGADLLAKDIELMHELLPAVPVFGVLLNPDRPEVAVQLKSAENAANQLGVKIRVLQARDLPEIEAAFAAVAQEHIGALIVSTDALFNIHRERIVALATHHSVPALYFLPEFAAAGGLLSYGSNLSEAFYQVGVYTGRVLKGEKPADLPIQQTTKVDLVINLKTAKALGLTIPLTLLGRADEVIE
jgi:putative ABC transport system substrate-binding protein